MGKRADEMRALRDNIHTSHAERTSGLQELFTGTRQLLFRFASDQHRMATEQCNRLRGFVSDLQGSVAALGKKFRSDHECMGTEQRNRLRGFVSDLRGTVAAMRKDFQTENAAAFFGSK